MTLVLEKNPRLRYTHLAVAYRYIKGGLISKLLIGLFSWHPQTLGTFKLDSIFSLFKCDRVIMG